MNSTRQIVRWSLPGLVFVLNLMVFHGLWLAAVDGVRPWQFIDEATAPAIVAVVAGGLPGGFLLYQLYSFRYLPVGNFIPVPWRTSVLRFFRADRGGNALRLYLDEFDGRHDFIEVLDEKPAQLDALKERIQDANLRGWGWPLPLNRPENHLHAAVGSLPKPFRCDTCVETHTARVDSNWTLLQSMIDFSSGNPKYSWLKLEYTSGSDLYHGLGAARTAVFCSGAVSLIYDGLIRPWVEHRYHLTLAPGAIAPAIVAVLAIALAESYVLSKCRNHVLSVHDRRIAGALAAMSRDKSLEIDKFHRR